MKKARYCTLWTCLWTSSIFRDVSQPFQLTISYCCMRRLCEDWFSSQSSNLSRNSLGSRGGYKYGKIEADSEDEEETGTALRLHICSRSWASLLRVQRRLEAWCAEFFYAWRRWAPKSLLIWPGLLGSSKRRKPYLE